MTVKTASGQQAKPASSPLSTIRYESETSRAEPARAAACFTTNRTWNGNWLGRPTCCLPPASRYFHFLSSSFTPALRTPCCRPLAFFSFSSPASCKLYNDGDNNSTRRNVASGNSYSLAKGSAARHLAAPPLPPPPWSDSARWVAALLAPCACRCDLHLRLATFGQAYLAQQLSQLSNERIKILPALGRQLENHDFASLCAKFYSKAPTTTINHSAG